MSQNIIKLFSLVFLMVSLMACGTKKHLIEEKDKLLPSVESSVLIEKLDSLHHQKPLYFTARMNAKYEDNSSSVSFKNSARFVADSALQSTLSFANIPIYNAIVTPDSLTLVDKRNKCFINEGLNFFRNSFNVDFSYQNIEELLLGLPVGWEKNNEYEMVNDPYNYILFSQFNKGGGASESKEEIAIRYFLSEDVTTLEKVIIESPRDTTSIVIDYLDHANVEGYFIPHGVDIHITTAKNEIFVNFRYTKVTINESSVLYLAIPNKYERCE